MEALERLTDASLIALGSGLRSHGLSAPFTPVSLERFCGSLDAPFVAAVLQRLHEEGMNAVHMALLADTIVQVRTKQREQMERVDLVWTGPEALGLTNRDTGVVVRELFGAAEFEVIVVGFAVHQGQEVFKRLAERMDQQPQLRVRLFLDIRRPHLDATPSSELIAIFVKRFRENEWPGTKMPELYYDQRSLESDAGKRSSLHAKCVLVDCRAALVTSANFTEAGQRRNIEVGALIRSQRYCALLSEHFAALVNRGILNRAM